jgi:hypothetical protein
LHVLASPLQSRIGRLIARVAGGSLRVEYFRMIWVSTSELATSDYSIEDRKQGLMSPLTNNWLIAVIVLNCALMAPLAGLQDQPGSPNRPLGTGVAAIVVDAVVRDGKSHPVTNLRKEDFELFEDGVRQEIGDVTVVCTPARREAGDGTVGRPVWTGQSRTGATGGGATTPSFLAIVFDRLTPEARALAYQGASAYLETMHESDCAAVYVSDLSLTTIQSYTNDPAKLRTALHDAASRATSIFDRAAMRRPDARLTASAGDAHPSVPAVLIHATAVLPSRGGHGHIETGSPTYPMAQGSRQGNRTLASGGGS